MTYKLLKSIRYIFIFIIILCISTLGYCAYDNLNSVRKSTNQLDIGINEIIIQDMITYDNDIKSLEDSRKKLADSEAKINQLIIEAEKIIND